MDSTKKPDLLALASILASTGTPYAVIGGVALQIHQAEPRTMLDIDLAGHDVAALPDVALVAAGFSKTGEFGHSTKWRGPGGTPVQFSDDPAFRDALERSSLSTIDGTPLRVVVPIDLVRARLRAAREPGPTPLEAHPGPRRRGLVDREPAGAGGRPYRDRAIGPRSGLKQIPVNERVASTLRDCGLQL